MTLGKDLMVFVNGKSVAFATSHTFNWEPTFNETSTLTKDTVGNATKQLMTAYSWTLSTDNLMAWTGDTSNTDTPAGNTFKDILQLGIAGTEVTLVFALGSAFSTTSGWSPAGTTLTGKGFVGSTSVTADVGDNASFSITFQGTGDITVV